MGSIAPHALVIVVLIAIGAFFALIIFWEWIAIGKVEASETTCKIKLMNFCEEWIIKDQEPNWEEIPPEGCEEFGITKPVSKTDCEQLVWK
jgi:hypothetical protein